jgi:patatin-like phospholipase/acyl hydrolase
MFRTPFDLTFFILPIDAMPGSKLRLLVLDGNGVCGLSALVTLDNLMEYVNPHAPPKPCDCFDMIGGTGTSG